VARRALERHPERAEPHVLLARALRAQGRTDEALAALDRAGALDANADLAAERALTLGQGGRVDEGIALARDALAREPESAGLEATLASLLFAAGDAGAGTRATDRALQRAPDEPHPLRVRCEFFASIGRFSDARDDCTRYLEARPDDAGARFMLGVALESLGESDAAAAAYRRAAQLDERDVRPRNNLAELLARQGDLDGALAAAQEAFGIDEGNAYVADTLGELYRKKGLPERAISLLEDAHAALPVPDVALHLALAYRDAGRTDEARALLAELQRDAQLRDELRASVATALASLP
jgi:tetratricopeptide (TPR) repeat protein